MPSPTPFCYASVPLPMVWGYLFTAQPFCLFPFYSTCWCLVFPIPLFHRLEYKYSKLVMNATLKDCDLPAADSCAIMEGEDVEDDLIFTSKKSLFGKIRSFTSKVGSLASALRSAWRAGEDTSPRVLNDSTLFRDHYSAPHPPYYSIPPPCESWLLPSVFPHQYSFPWGPRLLLTRLLLSRHALQWMDCLGLLTSRSTEPPML